MVKPGSAAHARLEACGLRRLHHAQRYGTRHLRTGLRAEGHAVGRYALRAWLRRCGLQALSTRSQCPTAPR